MLRWVAFETVSNIVSFEIHETIGMVHRYRTMIIGSSRGKPLCISMAHYYWTMTVGSSRRNPLAYSMTHYYWTMIGRSNRGHTLG